MSASRTFRAWIGALGCIAILASACGSDAPAGDEPAARDGDATGTDTTQGESRGQISVGLLNPLTGPFAALGEDVNAGFEMYVEAQGGSLAGFDVSTRQEDEANDVDVATTKARQLVDSGVDLIVGLVNSGVAYGVMDYLGGTDVPVLDTVAGANGLTQGEGGDRFFRVSYTGSQDNLPLGDYACKEAGYETAVLVALDYAFGWEASGGFARVYEDAGCEIVQEIYGPLATQDWAPFVQEIDRSADVVYVVAPGGDGIRFLQAYRDFGVELPVVAAGSTVDEQSLPEQQATAEGVVSALHWSRALDTPENRSFCDAFREHSGRSCSMYSENGYTAALVLESALELIDGDLTRDSLAEALGKVELQNSPRGPMRFDEYGQAVYNVYIRETQQVGGEWENVVIDTYSDVSQFWTYGPEKWIDEFRPYDELKGTWAD